MKTQLPSPSQMSQPPDPAHNVPAGCGSDEHAPVIELHVATLHSLGSVQVGPPPPHRVAPDIVA